MQKIIALLLVLLLALSLCACGEARSAASTPSGAYAGSYMVAADEAWPAEEPVPEAAMVTNGLSAAGKGAGDTAPAERPGKIIYSANVQVETTDFDGSLEKLDALVAEYGGWVESSSVSGSNYADRSRGSVSRRSANYTLRIPSDRFQELMGSLSNLGNVPYSHMYTENVTAQYYDVQARLTAYTAQEQRLLEMMEIAETVEDIIILEDRLTEVRYTIDSLQSSLNNWDRQVSYSTIYLDLTEVQEYRPEPQVQPSFGEQLSAALKEGLHDAGSFFKDLLLFLVSALPTLVILTALFFVFRPLLKKLSARNKERRAKRAAERAAIIAAKKAGIQDAKIEEQKKP
jgi:hypothetical protein